MANSVNYKNIATGDFTCSLDRAVEWYTDGFRVSLMYGSTPRCDISVFPHPVIADGLYDILLSSCEGTVVFCETDNEYHIAIKEFFVYENGDIVLEGDRVIIDTGSYPTERGISWFVGHGYAHIVNDRLYIVNSQNNYLRDPYTCEPMVFKLDGEPCYGLRKAK